MMLEMFLKIVLLVPIVLPMSVNVSQVPVVLAMIVLAVLVLPRPQLVELANTTVLGLILSVPVEPARLAPMAKPV